jgi:hypothetical protein
MTELPHSSDEEGADSAQSRCRDPAGELCKACRNRDLKRVEELIKEGKVDLDQPDDCTTSPLIQAIGARCGEIVEVLLRAGASMDHSALDTAVSSRNVGITRMLLKAGADVGVASHGTPLHTAAFMGHDTIIDMLISAGAPLNVIDHTVNYTPLQAAISMCQPRAAIALIRAGADVNLHRMSRSPLEMALEKGLAGVVVALRGAGAHERVAPSSGPMPVVYYPCGHPGQVLNIASLDFATLQCPVCQGSLTSIEILIRP